MSVRASEAAFDPERVGALGGEACLVFEGNQTFSRHSILQVLGVALEFHARAHPSAPLRDYLTWVEQTVLRSYQHAGFAKAAVHVQADRTAPRVRVHIAEGPRFRCGEVKVSGLDPTLAQQLKERLRAAAALREAPKEARLPGFSWPWNEGQPVPADRPICAAMEQSVCRALVELNRHQAQVRLELELDESRLEAALLIQVQNPGVVGTLDRIEVTTSGDWVKLLGGMVLRANDTLWPRGSWPWAVLQDATFLAAGKAGWVTNDLTNLPQSSEMGPLGCLVAAATFGRFDPHLAVPFARQGAARSTLAASPEIAAARASSLMTEMAGWLQQAAAQHYPPAMMLLGQFYLNGIGVRQDCAAAAALFRQAAERNHPHGGCTLARHYRDGRGVPRNLPEAVRWFRREAEAGCDHAMFDLAEVLLASAGASAQETDEAVRWLRKSASHGFVQAQSRLGSLLSDGISIKPDYLAAWVWYTLAAAQGDRVARMDARRLERRLTADQLESARQRVEQFGKPSKP